MQTRKIAASTSQAEPVAASQVASKPKAAAEVNGPAIDQLIAAGHFST